MANFEVPEGFVFVPRQYSDDRNQAAELLDAADALEIDQVEAVRTVSDGYHVNEEVAAKWSELYDGEVPDPEAEAKAAEAELGPRNEEGLIVLDNSELAGPETIGLDPDEVVSDEQVTSLPVNVDSSVAEIDDYAEKQGVDLTGATNRKEKIALLEAARNQPAADAE